MKTTITNVLLTVVLILISQIADAGNYTWTGNTSTAWNVATNWSPNTGYPSTNDTANIVTQTNNPLLDANRTIFRFKITTGTLDLNGYTLTVTGTSLFTAGTVTNGTIQPQGTKITFTATYFNATVNGLSARIFIDGGTFDQPVTLQDTGITTTSSIGGAIFNSTATFIKSGSNSGVWGLADDAGNIYNGQATFINTSDSDLYVARQDTTFFNNNVYVGSTGIGGVNFGGLATDGDVSVLASGKTLNINGTYGFTNGKLVLKHFIQQGTTSQSLTLTSSATLNFVNCTFNAALSFTAPEVVLRQNTFNGNASFTQTASNTTNSYGGNVFNGTATITGPSTGSNYFKMAVNADDTYNSNVTISGKADLVTNYSAIVKGNLTVGTGVNFTRSTFNGTLILTGTSNQTLHGNGVLLAMRKIKIDKASNSVTIDTVLTITDTLKFVKGKINTTSTHLISFLAGSVVTGTSDSGFVNGPVKKTGNTAFVFPVGKSSAYRAIEISAPSNTTDAFTGEYFNTSQTLGDAMDGTIKYLSHCDYWSLARNSGTSSVTINLNWDSTACPLLDSATARIGNWNGTSWKDLGNGGIAGNRYKGKISNTSGIITYGYFGLGFNKCFVTANAGSNQTICYGDSVTIGGTPVGATGTGSYSYSWTPATGLNNTSTATPKASPGTVTNYIVIVTDLNGCSNSDTVSISYHTALAVNVVGDGNNNDTATAHVTGGNTPYAFLWSNSSTDSIAGGLSSGLVYTVTVTDANGCTSKGVFSKIFTKVTSGSLVTDSNNTYFATWGDYDKDGDLDLFYGTYFASANNTSGNNLLFRNNCDGNLTKVQKIPGNLTTDGLTGAYAFWIDYDNDGDLDLYAGHSVLYENNGNGSFQSVSKKITNLPSYATSIRCAGWADYNNDGKLDVYFGKDTIYSGNSSKDFVAHGDAPFTSVSGSYRADAVSWADYDNDGYMDLYVANSNATNYLYHNNGNGTFTSITSNASLVAYENSYGVAWGDYNNDGLLDLWKSCNGVANSLYRNNGSGVFSKVTTGDIATTSATSQAGSSWADYDNDGDLDLFVPTFSQNLLFSNNGDGTFTKVTTEIPSADGTVESYGGAWADYDNDGDLDLAVPTAFGNPDDMFYTNNTCNTGSSNRNWVKFHLTGVTSNKDALGARVYVKATIGGTVKWQMREVNANSTRGGEGGGVSGHVVHFGLGNATTIDSIKIVWPASTTTRYYTSVTINKFYEAVENTSSLNEAEPCTPDLPVANPGYVSGRIYNDVNANCVYDAGTDYPIANKPVQAEPGAYFTFTNDTGYYTLDLPEGEFNISTNFNEDLWDLSSCQSDSLIPVTVDAADTVYSIDFSEQARIIPCDSTYDLAITSFGISQGPCPGGQILTSPCPFYDYEYCFTVTNNSPLASNTNTVLNVVFPAGYIITGVSANPYAWVPTGTNMISLTYPPALNSGGIISFCLTVYVTSNPPYTTTFDFQNPGSTGLNLIDDGNFESGTNASFTSDAPYALNCTSGQNHFCIGNNPSAMNGGWLNGLVAVSGTNFLYADGTSNPNTDVWSQSVTVTANTQYEFAGFFVNLARPNIPNLNQPNMQVRINNTPVFNTGAIAPGTGWIMGAFDWCSDTVSGSVPIDIRSTNLFAGGNDFGIDSLVFLEDIGAPASLTETDSCSCDPNDKLVTPMGCGENGNVKKDQELIYTIRFLNTGTGNAHNITLRDALDSDVDLSTLKILSSSHDITNIQIIPDTVLILTFGNIELEPDSSGFLTYSIHPKPGLADGTSVTNQAGIYFDNNEVVITNITRNTLYDVPEPNASFTYNHDCSIAGLVYDFTYTGSTPDNATYYWTFTDGTPSTSTNQNPNNITFSSAGYKYVTLTVNRNGCTDAVYDTILVVDYHVGVDSLRICYEGENLLIPADSLAWYLEHEACVGECEVEESSPRMAMNVESNEQSLVLKVYPNPANTLCHVNITGQYKDEELKLELLDFTGTTIKTIFNKPPENNSGPLLQKVVDISGFADGLYLLKVHYCTETRIGKLIIKH